MRQISRPSYMDQEGVCVRTTACVRRRLRSLLVLGGLPSPNPFSIGVVTLLGRAEKVINTPIVDMNTSNACKQLNNAHARDTCPNPFR